MCFAIFFVITFADNYIIMHQYCAYHGVWSYSTCTKTGEL